MSLSLIVIAALVTGSLAQVPAGCAVDCEKLNIPRCPHGPWAIQPDGCNYPGCPCGENPVESKNCKAGFLFPGQTSQCPLNCGRSEMYWITAVNGCKSCSCTPSTPKAGRCPTNLTPRDYYLARECGPGGDYDCFGVQKCCDSPNSANDMRCVDPQRRCPSVNPPASRFGKRCRGDTDCSHEELCCRNGFRNVCTKGVLPLFPSIVWNSGEMPSPTEWA